MRYLLVILLLISCNRMKNFHKVSDGLYRGPNPNHKQGWDLLRKNGVKTVLSLRYNHEYECPEGFECYRIPMRAEKPEKDLVLAAVDAIRYSTPPVYVHCLHGSDRTGIVVAAYRVIVMGWKPKKSFEEMKTCCNFHDQWWNKTDELFTEMYLNEKKK